jgi:maltose O-acetyltransferase
MAARNPFAPEHTHVMSRAWSFYVNSVAASPLLKRPQRSALLRRCGLEIDANVSIYPGCYFQSADVHLAEHSILNHGVHIENCARVEIGPRTGLGVHTLVLTSTHDLGPRWRRYGPWHYEPVTIGSGCWIGARSTILPGVTIGDGCLVAAGSVVTKDCEADGVYAGVPARRVRDLPEGVPEVAHAGGATT